MPKPNENVNDQAAIGTAGKEVNANTPSNTEKEEANYFSMLQGTKDQDQYAVDTTQEKNDNVKEGEDQDQGAVGKCKEKVKPDPEENKNSILRITEILQKNNDSPHVELIFSKNTESKKKEKIGQEAATAVGAAQEKNDNVEEGEDQDQGAVGAAQEKNDNVEEGEDQDQGAVGKCEEKVKPDAEENKYSLIGGTRILQEKNDSPFYTADQGQAAATAVGADQKTTKTTTDEQINASAKHPLYLPVILPKKTKEEIEAATAVGATQKTPKETIDTQTTNDSGKKTIKTTTYFPPKATEEIEEELKTERIFNEKSNDRFKKPKPVVTRKPSSYGAKPYTNMDETSATAESGEKKTTL